MATALLVYRAEGDHALPGYAGRVDVRTGRYFGTLDKAARYLTPRPAPVRHPDRRRR